MNVTGSSQTTAEMADESQDARNFVTHIMPRLEVQILITTIKDCLLNMKLHIAINLGLPSCYRFRLPRWPMKYMIDNIEDNINTTLQLVDK